MQDSFDFRKIQLESKDEIRDLLVMANRVLVTLGPGYFHQVYRRAFYYELEQANISFELAREVRAVYRGQDLGAKEVRFFQIGDLLLSAVAVQSIGRPAALEVSALHSLLSHETRSARKF